MDVVNQSEPSKHFFSCDWGTTAFRLRLVSYSDRQVIDEIHSQQGIKWICEHFDASSSDIKRSDLFEEQLVSALSELTARHQQIDPANTPVIMSGMVTSSVGWHELPYATVPFALNGKSLVSKHRDLKLSANQSIPVYLLSGVCTEHDVMRGEETEAIGLVTQLKSELSGKRYVLILPGTHSKHLWIVENRIESFQTYMTGELFEVLATHSLLSASVAIDRDGIDVKQLDQSAFVQGVQQAQQQTLSHNLFHVRTRQLLQQVSPEENTWFLSGLLLGTELKDLVQADIEVEVWLAATSTIVEAYQLALISLGWENRLHCIPAELVERAAIYGQATFLESLPPAV